MQGVAVLIFEGDALSKVCTVLLVQTAHCNRNAVEVKRVWR